MELVITLALTALFIGPAITLGDYLGRKAHRKREEEFRRIRETALEHVRRERGRITAQERAIEIREDPSYKPAVESLKERHPDPVKSRWEILKED